MSLTRHRAAISALAAVTVLALSACVRHYPPAPVVAGGADVSRAGVVTSTAPRPDSIVVAPGDTLYGVSRRYEVPLRSLIEANQLTPPFRLTTGRTLILPKVQQYIVQPGDTLNGVSRRLGVDVSTLARTNEIPPPYPIHVGQVLVLPASVVTTAAAAPIVTASAAAPGVAPPSTSAQAPAPVVIAGREPATPMVLPPLSVEKNYTPPTAPSSGPPVTRPAEPTTPSVPPVAATAPPPDPPPAKPSETQVATVTPPSLPVPPIEAHTGLGFQWPVHGTVLVAYGPGAGGTQNDGVNIAAPAGTPILAANDGEVKYAGNELRGYGNLILIKHPAGWTTAYAHCDVLLVKRGERVRRGQIIAKVGQTGTVSEPQLHFEIRRGTQPLDPASYLPPISTAAASNG